MRDPNMIFLPPYVSPYRSDYTPPTDEQWEGKWRTRVRENEERRMARRTNVREPITGMFIPSFLRMQAD